MAKTGETMFERLHTQKNYMQIAHQIRDLIRDGTLKVGEQLPPERTLVHQFGASRACVREALSALEMLGLIECRSGQGNYIKADGSEGTIDGEMLKALLSDHDPYEIFEARLELEPNMASLAAERATEEELAGLKAFVERLRTLGDAILKEGFKDALVDEYMDTDRRFHMEIGRAAHNNVLFTVYSGVNLMTKETHWKAMKSKGLANEENIRAYAEEHEAILAAILQKDSKAALRESKRHLQMLKKGLF
jgi:GntR family transcriptional regulator, transcriptional repressor for pyruvate dehydrogenase complex